MPNLLASYMQGQQAVENNKRNKLLDLQLQNAPAEQERANRLADLSEQRSRQLIDVTNSEQQKAQEMEGIKQSIASAQYIIQSKTPKLEAEQRYPKVVQALRAQGVDWDAVDDEGARQIATNFANEMSARAGIGPTPKLVTERGPNGQVIQIDPTTGKVTQAIAPQEDFRAKADYNDKLQRRRDAESRNFTLERDANNAQLQRELNEIKSRSKDEKATDGQRLSAGFLLRMQDVEPSFGKYTPTTKDYVLFNKILKNEGGLLGSGTAAELNKQLPAEAQEYFQQASDWVRAKLRKESGAVISPQEMLSEVSTYFPLPGDSQKTIEQKRRSREVAVQAMSIAAGSVGKGAQLPPREATPRPVTQEIVADGPQGPIVWRNGQWVPYDG